MRNSFILYILLLAMGLSSCNKGTEYDGFFDRSYNQISSDTIKLNLDTIGVEPFLAERYLSITAKEHRLLYNAKIRNLFSISGVALPESDYPVKDSLPEEIQKILFDCDNSNFFYGSPSAYKVGNSVLVIAERKQSEKINNDHSDNFFVTIGADGSYTETDLFKYAPYGIEFGGTKPLTGMTPDGKIVVKRNGLLISDGDLQHWKHYPYAFQSIVNSGKVYNDYGPVMTWSSKFGLFYGTGQSIDKTSSIYGALFKVDVTNGTVAPAKDKWVPKVLKFEILSDIQLIENPVFYSVEDADLSSHLGDIIGFGISKDKVYQFIYNYKTGDTFDSISFKTSITNIAGSLSRQSPVNIIYNTVTKRFEIIHSNPYSMEIWSMAPEDLLSNKVDRLGISNWTEDAVLLDREVSIRGQGMYPVSSVINKTDHTQTIYFSAGAEYPARSGIFKLTRTLETDKISAFVIPYRNYLATARF